MSIAVATYTVYMEIVMPKSTDLTDNLEYGRNITTQNIQESIKSPEVA